MNELFGLDGESTPLHDNAEFIEATQASLPDGSYVVPEGLDTTLMDAGKIDDKEYQVLSLIDVLMAAEVSKSRQGKQRSINAARSNLIEVIAPIAERFGVSADVFVEAMREYRDETWANSDNYNENGLRK